MTKIEQVKELVEKMTEIIKKYGLSHSEMAKELKRSIGIERIEAKGKDWLLARQLKGDRGG